MVVVVVGGGGMGQYEKSRQIKLNFTSPTKDYLTHITELLDSTTALCILTAGVFKYLE